MKKLIVFCLFMSFSLSACYDGQKPADITPNPNQTIMDEQTGTSPSDSPTEATPSQNQQTEVIPKPCPYFGATPHMH